MNHTCTVQDTAIVYYHGDHCVDGLASKIITVEGLRHYKGIKAIEAYPRSYHIPWRTKGYSWVVYVDFCPDTLELDYVAKYNDRVLILDHHPRALEMAERINNGSPTNATIVADNQYCGAMLAWHYFLPDKPVPRALIYIDDRDRWVWEFEQMSKKFSAAFAAEPSDTRETMLRNLLLTSHNQQETILYDFLKDGCAVLRYQNREVERLVGQAHVQLINGWPVLCVNTSTLPSEVCHRLLEMDEHKHFRYAATYYTFPTEQTIAVKYSVRSRTKTDDIKEVVESFGGGGHPCAGGMVINPSEQFQTLSLAEWSSLCDEPRGL